MKLTKAKYYPLCALDRAYQEMDCPRTREEAERAYWWWTLNRRARRRAALLEQDGSDA